MRISDWSSDVCSSDLARWPISKGFSCACRPPAILTMSIKQPTNRILIVRCVIFIQPVYFDVLGDIEQLPVFIAHGIQHQECGPDIGAPNKRAASAVDDHFLVFRYVFEEIP